MHGLRNFSPVEESVPLLIDFLISAPLWWPSIEETEFKWISNKIEKFVEIKFQQWISSFSLHNCRQQSTAFRWEILKENLQMESERSALCELFLAKRTSRSRRFSMKSAIILQVFPNPRGGPVAVLKIEHCRLPNCWNDWMVSMQSFLTVY